MTGESVPGPGPSAFRRRLGAGGGAVRHVPKIQPDQRAAALNWHVLGPGEPALGEWSGAGLELPDRDVIRGYRLDRVVDRLNRLGYAGIVLFDPMNVRYATDSTNMQVWILHNASRYCFVSAQGYVVMFEFSAADYLNHSFPLIDEVRPATAWYYFAAGSTYPQRARQWAEEIAGLVRDHGGGNTRLAVDRMNPEGAAELASLGISMHNGEEVMELARAIKHEEEIKAMRCAIHACETALDVMRENLLPGVSEQQLWSHLHAASVARGGEWIETRLLASGPRTNPWYQECSSRVIESGDLVAFDTDLIGSYGMCVDISRTWVCGDDDPSGEQGEIFAQSAEQIRRNTDLLRPGVTFEELTRRSFVPDRDIYRHYTTLFHGVGLCDEYPAICFPDEWDDVGYPGQLEPGMVLCVESYVARWDGDEGVKLEEQVLVTEDEPEVLSTYPLDLRPGI